jgi:hypothetical protein
MKNRQPPRSQYKGVYYDETRDRWIARIRVNGHLEFLGRFMDEMEAAEAYDTRATQAFGYFAAPNFKVDYDAIFKGVKA